MSDIFLQEIHNEHGTHHPTVPEGGTTIKAKNRRIGVYFTRRLEEITVRDSFNISLHARFDRIGGMGQVAREQSTQ